MFITFEGPDGAGKSTQIQLVAERLRATGRTVTVTREPGGSPNLGAQIRQLVLHTDIDLGARAEALLFAADRAEHVRLVIEPALAAGHVVLCDRFIDSTVAYQGVGRGLPVEEIEDLCDFATAGRVPDLTVVIDLDPRAASARQQERGDADRMEAANLGGPVRDLLLSRAAAHPDRYVVVDAGGTREEVSDRIWAVLPWGARVPSTTVTQTSPGHELLEDYATATDRPAAADLYVEADVRAAMNAIDSATLSDGLGVFESGVVETVARALLDAVAAPVGARVLREAARPMIAHCDEHGYGDAAVIADQCLWCSAFGVDQDWVERLTALADKLEPATAATELEADLTA